VGRGCCGDGGGGGGERAEGLCRIRRGHSPPPPIWIGANADIAVKRAARIGDCWYINPHNTLATIERQMDLYKRALDEEGKPFPAEVPMRREGFLSPPPAEANPPAQPFPEAEH